MIDAVVSPKIGTVKNEEGYYKLTMLANNEMSFAESAQDTGRRTGTGRGEKKRKRERIIGETIRSTNDRARDYVRRCLISSCEPVLGEEVSRLHQV